MEDLAFFGDSVYISIEEKIAKRGKLQDFLMLGERRQHTPFQELMSCRKP
jgi:hypothetical protein